MGNEYLALLVLICFAGLVGVIMVAISWLLGPKRATRYKTASYECGVEPVGDARERFPIKFYLVAMLFILFDIEVVFLWPWMTTFMKSNDLAYVKFTFFEVVIYLATWVLGYVYAIRVNAINFDDTETLPKDELTEDAA
jgi:NADH-quinone oxidoreductase subunit A